MHLSTVLGGKRYDNDLAFFDFELQYGWSFGQVPLADQPAALQDVFLMIPCCDRDIIGERTRLDAQCGTAAEECQ